MEHSESPVTDIKNPYGSPRGSGISMPPYYRPTPSVLNRNNYFPKSETLGKDEMRITFMGSQPFPPRLSQAGVCIMVELGNGKILFFDFGPGCMRNIIANQIPIAGINDIFLTHLHMDHYADLPYLWAFAPNYWRLTPLRVIGPSGRTPELGTKAMCENMKRMGAWSMQSFCGVLPVQDGFEIDVTEFDYREDGAVCYDKDGVKVIHWRRSHSMDGCCGFRLDWNGLSFVWTGDGKPDKLTATYAKNADVFVTEMVLDMPYLWALKQGTPTFGAEMLVDVFHTPHYGFGYLANLVQPRLAMATHLSYDQELVGEMMAGIRLHYKGFFAFGLDNTVVNVTKDRVWLREASIPETSNISRPTLRWLLKHVYNGKLLIKMPKFKWTIKGNQEQEVRDLEIDPALYTPKDQLRKPVRELPETMNLAKIFGSLLLKK